MERGEKFAQYLVTCFGISLIFTVYFIFSPKVHLGFFGNIASLILITILPAIGVFVGNEFRRFVVPDVYFASGAVDAFKKQVFWMIGPQCIGWVIGLLFARGIMINMLGYTQF